MQREYEDFASLTGFHGHKHLRTSKVLQWIAVKFRIQIAF
jgi:hypothetical protein